MVANENNVKQFFVSYEWNRLSVRYDAILCEMLMMKQTWQPSPILECILLQERHLSKLNWPLHMNIEPYLKLYSSYCCWCLHDSLCYRDSTQNHSLSFYFCCLWYSCLICHSYLTLLSSAWMVWYYHTRCTRGHRYSTHNHRPDEICKSSRRSWANEMSVQAQTLGFIQHSDLEIVQHCTKPH